MPMREKIFAYLQQRPAGASIDELLDLIFTHPGSDPEFGPRFLQMFLEQDPRFLWDPGEQRWKLREWATLALPLDAVSFVVVDLETTGLTPEPGGIMEIGAVRVERGRIVDEFQRLVRPVKPPPPFIVHLTGITWAMLREQPRLSDVWPEFVGFVGNGLLVAHNAAFDLSYLNLAAHELTGSILTDMHLCTLKLARRLVPETRRRGLDALAALFGIRSDGRHRALGDARITAEVLFHLLERARTRGVERLDQLLALQQVGRDGRPFYCPLPRSSVETLPNEPGVYRFYDDRGRLLYVGRAKDLRRRVASYLANSDHHSDKVLDLIRHIHEVRVECCPSELEAALREAEAIRREKPPYNQRLKHLPQVAYLRIGRESPFPRVSIAQRLRSRSDLLVGPLRSRQEAERLLRIWLRVYGLRTCRGSLVPDPEASPCFQGQTGLCTMPCAARIGEREYHARVQALLEDIAQGGAGTRAFLIAERDRLVELERFEAAQRWQEEFVFFERLCARFQELGWVTREQHFLLLLPRSSGGALEAYLMLSGRLVGRTSIHHANELVPWLQAQIEQAQAPRADAVSIDATIILAAWLRDRKSARGALLRLPPAETNWPATLFEEWRASCAALLAAPCLHLPVP
jgi:DNA polymerase-3 subunit epsilon